MENQFTSAPPPNGEIQQVKSKKKKKKKRKGREDQISSSPKERDAFFSVAEADSDEHVLSLSNSSNLVRSTPDRCGEKEQVTVVHTVCEAEARVLANEARNTCVYVEQKEMRMFDSDEDSSNPRVRQASGSFAWKPEQKEPEILSKNLETAEANSVQIYQNENQKKDPEASSSNCSENDTYQPATCMPS